MKGVDIICQHVPVACLLIDILQALKVGIALGKGRSQLPESDVMQFADDTHVVHTDVVHLPVHEEEVRIHVVRPTVLPPTPHRIHLLLQGQPADEELLEHAGIQFLFVIQLVVILQDGAHRLAQFLLLPVPCNAHRCLLLVPVHAYHDSCQPPDKVVLQRDVALHSDVFLLGDGAPAILHRVAPLVAVHIPFVPFTFLAVMVHAVPGTGGTKQNVHVSLVAPLFFVVCHGARLG